MKCEKCDNKKEMTNEGLYTIVRGCNVGMQGISHYCPICGRNIILDADGNIILEIMKVKGS